ncbi:MAG TPA: PKD domain-containing protein, partial [Thermoplasmata archaeon]|nr:PKD domain-containing protein [Thermoplasmata archaeon]
NGSSGGPPGGSGQSGQEPPKLAGAYQESVSAGRAPLLVQFTATPTGGSAPYAFVWSFGDGSVASGEASVSHTYTASGSFLPVVTITDAKGSRVSLVLPAVVVSGRLASAGPVAPSLPANVLLGSLLAGTLALVGAGLILHRRRIERLRREGELFLRPPSEP